MRWLVLPGVLMVGLGPLFALDAITGDESASGVGGVMLGVLIALAGVGLCAISQLDRRDF